MLTLKEFKRKLVHIALGAIIVTTYYYNLLSPLALLLLITAGIMSSLISKRINLPIFSEFINWFERDEVKQSFPGRGLIFFLVGSLLAIQLFEKNIALAAIMVLTLGDSFSHIIGGKYGRLKNIFNLRSKKLFEGTLAGSLAGFLGALIFVPFPEAFLGSFAAMIAEVIEIDLNQKSVDDNIVVPLIAGTVMYLVAKFV